jgi:hypothetical protein
MAGGIGWKYFEITRGFWRIVIQMFTVKSVHGNIYDSDL